jgi:hypothetical protein
MRIVETLKLKCSLCQGKFSLSHALHDRKQVTRPSSSKSSENANNRVVRLSPHSVAHVPQKAEYLTAPHTKTPKGFLTTYLRYGG